MLEGSSWGDESMLTCISMMWQITITVVFAEELSQYKIRHQRKLEDADLVLIFAGDSHYLGACKCSFVFIFQVLRQLFQCCAGGLGAVTVVSVLQQCSSYCTSGSMGPWRLVFPDVLQQRAWCCNRGYCAGIVSSVRGQLYVVLLRFLLVTVR